MTRWRKVGVDDGGTVAQPTDDGAMRVLWPAGFPDIKIGDTVALKVDNESAIYQLMWIEDPIPLDFVDKSWAGVTTAPIYVLRPSF